MRGADFSTMKHRGHRAFLYGLLGVALALLCALPGFAEGERSHTITRLDEDGYLYYMDYTQDYYGAEVMDALRKAGYIDAGCSVPRSSPMTRREIPSPAGTTTIPTVSPGRIGP